MSQTRTSEDDREVLAALAEAPNGLSGVEIQRRVEQWPVRPTIDRLLRKGLIDHDGYRFVAERQHHITDAGRAALR